MVCVFRPIMTSRKGTPSRRIFTARRLHWLNASTGSVRESVLSMQFKALRCIEFFVLQRWLNLIEPRTRSRYLKWSHESGVPAAKSRLTRFPSMTS